MTDGFSLVRPDEFYAEIDYGIRFAVKLLHCHGIATCQSCQGGPGHSYPRPTIDMRGSAHGQPAFAALHHLETYGLEVYSLSQVWNVAQGRIHETVWRIELCRPCPERDVDQLVSGWRFMPLEEARAPSGQRDAYEQQATEKARSLLSWDMGNEGAICVERDDDEGLYDVLVTDGRGTDDLLAKGMTGTRGDWCRSCA